MYFKNETNPNTLPVDGDIVEYEIHGRTITESFDLNVFENLLNVAEKERQGGLAPVDFRRLFTFAELVAIDNAEWNDGFSGSQKANIRTFTKSYQAAQTIRLDHAETIAGINMLIAYGLLTKPRADDILIGKSV